MFPIKDYSGKRRILSSLSPIEIGAKEELQIPM
jgi:hypothetical protein